jgi:hypothetical protein
VRAHHAAGALNFDEEARLPLRVAVPALHHRVYQTRTRLAAKNGAHGYHCERLLTPLSRIGVQALGSTIFGSLLAHADEVIRERLILITSASRH